MLTTMEEEVDELWTSSVTRMPITSPATGLDRTQLSWEMLPAALPGCVQPKVVQVEPPEAAAPALDGPGLQSVPVRPQTLGRTVVTSDELESRGEDVEGADEDVEEGEQQEQLPRRAGRPQHFTQRIQS